MLSCRKFFIVTAIVLIATPAFSLEWHKAYERGRDRIKSGDCSQGQSLMQEAIRGNPKPDPRTPTYGTMVIEYFPQYYLAICAVQAGNLKDAQRYIKESEGGRIASSKLAGEFQTLKSRVDSMAPQQQPKPADPKPIETKPPQPKVDPKPPPEEKKDPPTRIEPVVKDNSVAINSALRDARQSLREGRYDEARSAANRALGMQPDNREARGILNDISSRQAAETQAQDKREKIKAVEQAIRRGDLDAAENQALALKVQYPSDSNIASLLQQINDQKSVAVQDLKAVEARKTVERQVLTAYYNGNYDQAIQIAKDNLSKVPQSWRLHFFLGCSYAALSMLEENETDARMQLAREYFRRARSLSSSASLPPHISPKILDIYRSS